MLKVGGPHLEDDGLAAHYTWVGASAFEVPSPTVSAVNRLQDSDNAPVCSGVFTPPYPSAVHDYYSKRLNFDVCAVYVVRAENIEAVYAWLLGQHREPSQFYFVGPDAFKMGSTCNR
jgi:hypothetical protein